MRRVFIINSDSMGRGNDELGRKIIVNFFRKLPMLHDGEQTIVLYNTGVLLAAEGSPVLAELHALEEEGFDLISCQTCVESLKLVGKIRAGKVGSMEEIVREIGKAAIAVTL